MSSYDLYVTFRGDPDPDRPTEEPTGITVACQLLHHRLALCLKEATAEGRTEDSDLVSKEDQRLRQLVPTLESSMKPVDPVPHSIGDMITYRVPKFVSDAVESVVTTGKLPSNSKVARVWVAERAAKIAEEDEDT